MPEKKIKKSAPRKNKKEPVVEPQADLKEAIAARYRHKAKANVWMWTGVVIFTIIIAVLWGWSLKLRASFFSWGDFKESQLVAQTQADWDALFTQTKAEELQNELNKIQLKNILNQLTQTTPVTTTVSTTTP